MLAIIAGVTQLSAAPGTPYIPAMDAEIVEIVRARPVTRAERRLREQLARPGLPPLSFEDARDLARDLIAQARGEGDPRFLGQAETVLLPWWDATNPPTDLLILRATIEQGRHEFLPALATLDRAIRLDPRSAGAWLTRATIHTVRGDFAAARQDCLAVARCCDPLTALTATASVAALTGHADAALKALELQLARDGTAFQTNTVLWAHTVAAEIAERLGRDAVADRHFTDVFQRCPQEPYAMAVWADYRLSRGFVREVVERLQDAPRSDALLLRLAEARVRIAPDAEATAQLIQELGSRIDQSHARGSRVHLREEARYELHLQHHPKAALELALANWEIQREPVDWRLLVEAAQASGNAPAEALARGWADEQHYEDPRWQSVATKPLAAAHERP